ncbi:MAG: monovalent cation/H(+) antiporter subunit G [Treponema sp.]|nr:monovalent cation/H(+) antiporter subunit G [Treponema sp.]
MIVLQWARFVLAALLLLGGMIALFGTVVGIFRFKYVLNRIHIAAKCDTFGLLLTFSSLIVMLGWSFASLKILLILIFIWITHPVASHLIANLEASTNPNVTNECEVIRHDAD